jgi:hypothetical protein
MWGEVYIPSYSYHMPDSDIRLTSPQSIMKRLGGDSYAKVDGYKIEWHLPDGRIVDIAIDPVTNLPLLQDFLCSQDEKCEYGDQFLRSHVNQAYRCDFRTKSSAVVYKSTQNKEYAASLVELPSFELQSEEEKSHNLLSCADDPRNRNLSGPQRELLHWHQKLCLNMRDVQMLMKPQIVRDQGGKVVAKVPPVLPTTYKSTKNLKPEQFPLCLACKISMAKAQNDGVKTSQPIPEKQGILSRNKYEPGDSISTYQYVVKTPVFL